MTKFASFCIACLLSMMPLQIYASPGTELLKPKLCGRDNGDHAVCFDGQWSFDLIRSRFDQYAYFPSTDFSRPMSGYSMGGAFEMHFDYTQEQTSTHLGFVYLPKADEPSDDLTQRPLDRHRSALRLDEAYVMFMPLDWVPFALKFGSSYTSFGQYGLNLHSAWQDYPFLSTPTWLITQTLSNNVSLLFDDHINSGFSFSAYMSASEDTLDSKGTMEAWGSDIRYYSPKFYHDQGQVMLGAAYVSNAAGARFLSSDNAKTPAYAFNLALSWSSFSFEFADVYLIKENNLSPRAFDFLTKYNFEGNKRYLAWGWSKTSEAGHLQLPQSAWWIAAYQQYSDNLSLLATVKRQNPYSSESHFSDYLYGFRIVLDIF